MSETPRDVSWALIRSKWTAAQVREHLTDLTSTISVEVIAYGSEEEIKAARRLWWFVVVVDTEAAERSSRRSDRLRQIPSPIERPRWPLLEETQVSRLEIVSINGKVPKKSRPRDTLEIARTIMDECGTFVGYVLPADELALCVLLEGESHEIGMLLSTIVRVFHPAPRATVVGVVDRAVASGRVKRVKVSHKIVFVKLTTRGISERTKRRGIR